MTTVLTAGLSLKPQYYEAAAACRADGLWFEVHPENYMVAGGPRLAWLEKIREQHGVSLHGVALSLAADTEPDASHLARLASLAQRVQPTLMSEHLAWSTWRGAYHPDLLPFPRTDAALLRIADNISRTQDALQRRIAIENPSHYLDAFPAEAVMEIHLAGHTPDPKLGATLLVDTHDAPVAPEVWALYERLIRRIGTRPTLIERDDNLPEFATLFTERLHAERVLRTPLACAA